MDLKNLEKRLDEIEFPLPYNTDGYGNVVDANKRILAESKIGPDGLDPSEEIEFMVAAANALPELINEIDRLKKELLMINRESEIVKEQLVTLPPDDKGRVKKRRVVLHRVTYKTCTKWAVQTMMYYKGKAFGGCNRGKEYDLLDCAEKAYKKKLNLKK
jgi:hypothetical protein